MSTRLGQELRELAERLVADEDVPGASLAIVRRDGYVAAHAGSRDGSGRAADTRTLYRIASISKTFTATAVLALRDSGRLGLDDPVVDHLQEFAAVRDPFGPIEAITVRMLLQHASGLQSEAPAIAPEPWRPLPIAEILERLDRTAVVIPPASAHKYSNVGYDLLGELIGRVSGTPYAVFIRQEILEPLGMRATTLDPSPDQASATGFDPRDPGRPDAARRQAAAQAVGAGQGSGGWWSCIEDLAAWLRAQLAPAEAGSPLRIDSIREMHAPAYQTDDRGGAYGLGWRVESRGGRTTVGHGGLTYGFESIVGFDRDAETGAIALVNGIPSSGSMLDLRTRMLDLVSGHEPVAGLPTEPAARDADGARPGELGMIGPFREVGFHNEVSIGRGPVLIEADGRRRALLATVDAERFLVGSGRAAGESLRLVRDGEGDVIAIELAGYYFERIPGPAH